MKKILLLTLLIHILISLWACNFLEEITNNSIPEITKCSLETDHFLLQFSTNMNRNITEQAVSLSFEDIQVEGRFSWSNNKMQFYPHEGIIDKGLYILKIKSSAEDKYGNSLIRDQSWQFNTREDSISPEIISVLPADQSEIGNLRQAISYIFSESIDPMTFRNSLDINPSLEYYIDWSEKDYTLQIHPLKNYSEGDEYKFSVKTQLQDLAGNKLEQEHNTHYKILSKDDLLLKSLVIESRSVELECSGINEKFEKNDVLHGRFNRSLNSDEIYGLVSIQPDVSFNMEWDIENIGFTLYFTEALKYGESYDLNILDQKYTVFCNGVESIPITIEALSFSPEEGVEPLKLLSLDGSLSAYDSETASLEFTVNHSPLADINLSSFMTALSVESSVLSFNFISLELKAGTIPGQSLIKIQVKIADSAIPGIVRFSLENTVHDSLDNSLKETWALTVNQP